jgi:hypothetical protein
VIFVFFADRQVAKDLRRRAAIQNDGSASTRDPSNFGAALIHVEIVVVINKKPLLHAGE